MITKQTRLHKAVSIHLKKIDNNDFTQPEIQRNIEKYGVKVDDLDVFNRLFWVLPGQTVQINNWPKRDHGDFDKIKIIEESNKFLLLFKPFGVVVQPGAGHLKDNLVMWLLAKYPELEKFDPTDYPSRGLAHRIDKNTQGLLLVAKDIETLDLFQSQFRRREVVKKYLCIVEGLLDQQYTVKAYQSRDKLDVKRQKMFWTRETSQAYDAKSRFAHSVIKPLAVCPEIDQTLVEVEIKTGRMHQIRLHMQAIEHPLVGDHVYNKKILDLAKAEQKTIEFDCGWHSFYPSINVKKVSASIFLNYKKTIFDDENYCLLSNQLKITLPDNKILDAEIINIQTSI